MTTQVTQANAKTSPATGIAYPLVAQASAFLIVDGTTFLGSVTLMNLAGIAVATKKFVETKDPTWLMVIAGCMDTIAKASKATETIAGAAATVLKSFPPG